MCTIHLFGSLTGGLDSQIQEIREVIELPITKPELFEEMGIVPQKGKCRQQYLYVLPTKKEAKRTSLEQRFS